MRRWLAGTALTFALLEQPSLAAAQSPHPPAHALGPSGGPARAPVDVELLDGRMRLRSEYLLRWRVVETQGRGAMVVPHDALRLELSFLRGWLRFVSIAWETTLPREDAAGPGAFALELSAALDERSRWSLFSTVAIPAHHSSASDPQPTSTPRGAGTLLRLGARRRF